MSLRLHPLNGFLFNPAWLFIRATRKENQKWVVLLRKTTIISYEPPSSSSEIHWNPFHTFKNFHVGWHSSTLEPPAFWGVWHPWHLPNLASESCAIWVSCSRYVPTCSSAWEGITRNPPVNEHISPLKGTFESMMFLFPFGWDMLVPGRGTPCYTPMSMWTFHHQISLFKNGPLFESEQWIDLAPELVPVGIAHPSAVGDNECLKPQPTKITKRLAPEKHDDINRFKSFKNFQGFSKDRIFQTSGALWWPQPNDFTEVLRLANLPQVARMVFL